MKDLIELVMQRKNITQKELCDLLQISYTTIKRLKGTMTTGTTSSVMKEKIRQKLEELVDAPIETQDQYDLRIERQNFRLQERNKLLNKENRGLKKSEFVMQDFMESLLDKLDRFEKIGGKTTTLPTKPNAKSLIVQLSDLHLGSTVKLKSNVYNMQVAEFRLSQYAEKVISIIKSEDIREVVLLNTGDCTSLNYRTAQLLEMEGTRAETYIRGMDLICNFIDSIANTGANVRVIGVLSNESRLKGYEHPSMSDDEATDSFDYILHQSLKRMYSKVENITFENECNTLEYTFGVKGHKILALHGHTMRKHDDKTINTTRLNCLAENGFMPDMMLFGHIHEPTVGSYYARSGSLMGSNSYSKNGLSLAINKPSQNMFLVDEESITPIILYFK